MLFKLSFMNSNLALTLGYLNPALNNSALGSKHLLPSIACVAAIPLIGAVSRNSDN